MANADAINLTIACIRGEIEATKEIGFNMVDFVHVGSADRSGRHCGTVACIAGHAALASGATLDRATDHGFDIGRDFLEITESEADDLFIWLPTSLDTTTPEQAIRTLEHLRDTGEVSWEV